MTDDLPLFLRFDYPEAKDLCKHFLTLISATLVFSVAFSEKVVNYAMASLRTRHMLLGSWLCMILAVVLVGLGFFILFNAGLAANHHPSLGEHPPLRGWAYLSMTLAGGSYVIGLATLVAAAWSSRKEQVKEIKPIG